MSGKAFDKKIIVARDGQTQDQRIPQWLPPENVAIDNRTVEELWAYAKKIAGEIHFYNETTFLKDGTWEDFFDLDAATVNTLSEQQALPPHLAVFSTFLQLYKEPQRLLNNLTGRHLDFYYGDVLGLKKAPAVPDKVHLLFSLKKNAGPVLLPKGTTFIGGKDISYKLLRDTLVNHASVARVRSLFINPQQKNALHVAPVANSADGLGSTPDPLQPAWKGFGDASLPLAKLGFALSSDVLRLNEGSRKITAVLELENFPAFTSTAVFAQLFEISLTGEKGWIGPFAITPSITGGSGNTATATLDIFLSENDPAVTDFNPGLHGYDFDTTAPLLQLLLNNQKGDFGYEQLKTVNLKAATLNVEVNGIKNLQLENDAGVLNAKKPFLPFGATPDTGATFYVGCEEAFTKRLKNFSITLNWKNIPINNLATYFDNYPGNISNESFTVTAAFKDGRGWASTENTDRKSLFNQQASSPVTLNFTNPSFSVFAPLLPVPWRTMDVKPAKVTGYTLKQSLQHTIPMMQPNASPSLRVQKTFSPLLQLQPVFWVSLLRFLPPVAKKKGYLTLRLNQSFLFREYREVYAKAVLDFTKQQSATPPPALPKEPFAPEVQSLTFNYSATSGKVLFTDASLNDYLNAETRFFHIGVFGQMREHLYQHAHAGLSSGAYVKLLPQYPDEGELYVGITGIGAADSLTLLFQLAEGSANPDKAKTTIRWMVLCDNYWKKLDEAHITFDSTKGLLTSGVMQFLMPQEATVINTLLQPDFIWLKGAVQQNADAVSRLLAIQANAGIAQYVDDGRQPEHLHTPLPPSSISKLATPVGNIKSIRQPSASFGGRRQETATQFYIRVSERLRHKERSIALWDYERLLLQHFPQLYKVKCIPHASDTSFCDPGHTLTVVVPHLTNQFAANPFQPKADKNTLDQVLTFLEGHSTTWASHHVRNPVYEPVKVVSTLVLQKGKATNFFKQEANKQLQQFLSPWASGGDKNMRFGGKLTKSMIIRFLESLDFVDYIADLKLLHAQNGGSSFGSDSEVVEASNPAAILVSHIQHDIKIDG